jgi:hypothetical protein
MNTYTRIALPACAASIMALLACPLLSIAADNKPPARSSNRAFDIYSEKVTFKDTSNPDILELEDGRTLVVNHSFKPSRDRLSFDEVFSWKEQHPLRLVYNTRSGVVLVDSKTGKELPVRSGLNTTHPLDNLLQADPNYQGGTMAIAQAYEDSVKRWDKEISRILEQVKQQRQALNTKTGKDTVQLILQSQQTWETYRKQHLQARGQINQALPGTITIIEGADYWNNFVRNRAIELADLFGMVDQLLHGQWD